MKNAELNVPTFDIGTKVPIDDLGRTFHARRRLHVPEFLNPAGAEALYEHLAHQVEWSYFLFNANHLWEVPADVRREYTPEQHREVVNLAYTAARDGYSFIYETSPRAVQTEDRLERAQHKSVLKDFEEFLNSQRFLAFARRLTGAEDIARVEAIATCFRPGHFLAPHDDSAVDTRRAAYVFNMTRSWRVEWGGLLEFINEQEHVEEAWVPRFNSFNVFGVPQAHAVSCVSPFAGVPRFAVSGWFHAARI